MFDMQTRWRIALTTHQSTAGCWDCQALAISIRRIPSLYPLLSSCPRMLPKYVRYTVLKLSSTWNFGCKYSSTTKYVTIHYTTELKKFEDVGRVCPIFAGYTINAIFPTPKIMWSTRCVTNEVGPDPAKKGCSYRRVFSRSFQSLETFGICNRGHSYRRGFFPNFRLFFRTNFQSSKFSYCFPKYWNVNELDIFGSGEFH